MVLMRAAVAEALTRGFCTCGYGRRRALLEHGGSMSARAGPSPVVFIAAPFRAADVEYGRDIR